MKKKYYIIILIVIFIIAYKGYKVFSGTSKSKEIVTIYMKNNEIKKGTEDAIKDFNDENEDINIKIVLTNDDYNNLVFTKLANENGIDIFEYNGRTLFDKEFIRPLSSLNLDLSNVNSDNFLMYNLDLLEKYNINIEKYPETLDELIVLLEDIKTKTGETPLTLSLNNIHDLFSIVGGMAISENTTYQTFWNYKTGEYDFNGLSEVLKKLNYMYTNKLINEDFDLVIYEDLYKDIKNTETFIIPINYYEKYDLRSRYFDYNFEFTDIPTESSVDKNYYYTYSRTLVLANNNKEIEDLDSEAVEEISKHDEAVKYVFEWLISENTVGRFNEMDANFSTLSSHNKEDKYNDLSDDTGYLQLSKDPTEVLAGDSKTIRNSIVAMIKGEVDIEEGISSLNEEYNKLIKDEKRNQDVDLSKYKE